MFLPHQLHAMPAVNQLVETEFGTQDHMRSSRDGNVAAPKERRFNLAKDLLCSSTSSPDSQLVTPSEDKSWRYGKDKNKNTARLGRKIAFSHFPQQEHAVALIGNIIDNTERKYRQLIEYKVPPPCMDANKYGLHLWPLFGSDGWENPLWRTISKFSSYLFHLRQHHHHHYQHHHHHHHRFTWASSMIRGLNFSLSLASFITWKCSIITCGWKNVPLLNFYNLVHTTLSKVRDFYHIMTNSI